MASFVDLVDFMGLPAAHQLSLFKARPQVKAWYGHQDGLAYQSTHFYATTGNDCLPLPTSLSPSKKIATSIHSFLSSFIYHLHTLYLFSKSDAKTTHIPVVMFAIVAAPLASLWHLPQAAFWVWLQCLMFQVQNQTLDPEEDKINKSWRPIPAKRITWENARVLRWMLIPVCLLQSACYSIQAVYATIVLLFFSLCYNDVGFGKHWAGRNVLVALGTACFEVGTTLVAGTDRHALNDVAMLCVLCSAGVLATTTHTQDFQDTEGDRLIGRKTLPIMFPNLSRFSIPVLVTGWSIGLSLLWRLSLPLALVFNALGLAVSMSSIRYKSIQDAKRCYKIYCLWLLSVHALPAYYRYAL